ncbi:MAG: UvrD-helicase domain-containing protein, partial [Nitrospinae bacterium]|nr:UvrD-helicase domain-containing protein [Nitrospinota bacterium]
ILNFEKDFPDAHVTKLEHGYTKDFTVYDARDQERLIKAVLTELGLAEKDFPARQVGAFISRFKNRLLGPAEAEKEVSVDKNREYLLAFQKYETRLRQARCMDFDDLLGKSVLLLRENGDVREYYRSRFKYLLVDEFQDTNAAQYELIRLLLNEQRNICVVGDDDQSIYQWRGADIGNILNFEKDFPDAHVTKLEQNYRSTGAILKGATAVVRRIRERKEKTLWTENADGSRIVLYTAHDETDEARWIVATLVGLIRGIGHPLSEIALFYRTNSQSRAIEEALRGEGIPYVVYGGLKFYERKEIKDLLAYFRAAQNLADVVSFKRIVNTPPRGLGGVTIERLEEAARERGLSLAETLDEVESIVDLNSGAKKKLTEFRDILAAVRRLANEPAMTAAKAFDEAMTATGYLAWLATEETSEARSRMENLEELVSAAEDYAERTGDPSVAGFLDQAALVADADAVDEATGAVKLMTVHISKGLEFDAVFVTGLEENVFPHARSKEDPSQMSEERRLMYVAMTRARKRLFLTHAQRRRTFGVYTDNLPSRFLADLPAELLEREISREAVRPGATFTPTLDPAPTSVPYALARAGTASARPAPKVTEEGWKIGDKVSHPTFAVGKIMGIEGSGEKAKLTVYFPRFGEKKLVKKFANLTKA